MKLLNLHCIVLAAGFNLVMANSVFSKGRACDTSPTDIKTTDYNLDFVTELMPDTDYNGRLAHINVHRVEPVYENGRCPGPPKQAVVLIHGRAVAAGTSFDLQQDTPDGEKLSLQEALAWAGIDTFAPDLTGYGRSSKSFDLGDGLPNGLDDPCNASLRAYNNNGTPTNIHDDTCPWPEGCDRNQNIPPWALDQQGRVADGLWVNPLGGDPLKLDPLENVRCEHSSNYRFMRMDGWARDIHQVIDDAIEKAQPKHDQVVLVGYSEGGRRIGRYLYPNRFNAAHPYFPSDPEDLEKISRVVFISSVFNLPVPVPVEETEPPIGFASFPMDLDPHVTAPALSSEERDDFCTGRVVPDSYAQVQQQIMEEGETDEQGNPAFGATWGGSDPNNPVGLIRSPTYSGYGWNNTVAGTLSLPTLLIHGSDDRTILPVNSSDIYKALPASLTSKILVNIDCASHNLVWEGCSQKRCDDDDPDTRPYGVAKPYGQASQVWGGPHATVKGALIEWITKGTFNEVENGCFRVNPSGVAIPAACP